MGRYESTSFTRFVCLRDNQGIQFHIYVPFLAFIVSMGARTLDEGHTDVSLFPLAWVDGNDGIALTLRVVIVYVLSVRPGLANPVSSSLRFLIAEARGP